MSTSTRDPYIGKHHRGRTALHAAVEGGDVSLLPSQELDGHDVALGLCLTGPVPHLTLTSDHDELRVALTPAQLERFLDEVAKIVARPQVELRTVAS